MLLKVDLIAGKLDVKSLSSFSASRDGFSCSKFTMGSKRPLPEYWSPQRVKFASEILPKTLFEIPTTWNSLACYYTLRTIPK